MSRSSRGRYLPRITEAQKRYLWRAAQLRDRLTDKALAKRLNLNPMTIKNKLSEMRKAAT
jgi:DNA-binding CsgD family transcriptional regulator